MTESHINLHMVIAQVPVKVQSLYNPHWLQALSFPSVAHLNYFGPDPIDSLDSPAICHPF